ncbi:histidine kinase [Streptomyces sioyaensis]|uniref:sensor histidine kinase n=1 Tax=Streptomyces sioyaensis TaxID=67364 RepID=UPI0036DFA546
MHATGGQGGAPASFMSANPVMQIVGFGLLIGTLATARENSPVMWAVYGASSVCWFASHFLVDRRPLWAGIALVSSAAMPAAAAGWAEDSTAVIMVGVMLGWFAAWSRPRAAALWLVLSSCLALTLISSATGGAGLGDLAGYALVMLLLTLLGLNQRQYRLRADQAEQLLRQTTLMQQEQAQVAVLEERARIAREIHDVLAHSLGALTVQLKAADALLDNGDIEGVRARIRRSNRLTDEGLAEAAAAVAALRDEVLPLPDMLAELIGNFRRDHRTEIRLTTTGTTRPLPSGPVVALVRATREALTNAAKHAPGGAVDVVLNYDDSDDSESDHSDSDHSAHANNYGNRKVRLEVRNDIPRAAAFVDDGPPVSGYGLTGMRERLALAGGTLQAGPDATHRSWRLVVELPG